MNSKVGQKTKQLLKLVKAGFRVPKFITITSEEIEDSTNDLIRKIKKELHVQSYAVRSSAFAEDQTNNSMAGQFHTELDVQTDDLVWAIENVRSDAKEKLGSLKEFSIIIQEYIHADFAGVTFTQNPRGGRETLIEYVKGPCEALVSGKITPSNLQYFKTEKEVSTKLPIFEEMRETFQRIEQLFDSPQDIEWCIRNKKLFILQSRPITTLTKTQIDVANYLNGLLPRDKFFFEKTGVSDVAPRPTPPTFSILQKLYVKNGSVDSIYQKHGIKYENTGFLKIIGNELYIDREKELKSLFPSYSYFNSTKLKAKPTRLKGILTSFKNSSRFTSLSFNIEELEKDLKQKLSSKLDDRDLKSSIDHFLVDYATIFEINLAAEFTIKKLEYIITDFSLPEALQLKVDDYTLNWIPPKGLTGNTLELSDKSKFVHVPNVERTETYSGKASEIISQAQKLTQLREYGRWLAIKHINQIAKHTTFKQPTSEFLKFNNYSLPTRLTHQASQIQSSEPLGVSFGMATGIAVNEKTIDKKLQNQILITDVLKPSLTEYQNNIIGVVSQNGGMLSHFAIIARELKMPVVVNADISRIKLGDKIQINGSTGEIN